MLDAWVQTPPAQALGVALLHSIWQAALAASTLAVALLLTRKASARVRHDAALLLLLCVPAAFAVTFALSYPQNAGQAPMAIAAAGGGGAAGQVSFAAEGPSWLDRLAAVSPWLAPWWLAGVLLFNVRRTLAWLSVRRLRTANASASPQTWQLRLDELAKGMRVSAPVRLLLSSRVDSPVVMGLWKPVVLVPLAMLTSTPASHVELILLHELAHVRRRDYAVNLLRGLVESLFFYHPAVWWMSSIIAEEREHCCDDLAVEVSQRPREYAEALFGLEVLRGTPEPALGAAGGSLVRRVRRLLGRPEAQPQPSPALALAGAALLAGLALLAQPVFVRAAPQDPTAMTSYEKWVAHDVSYIIEPEEKAAFAKLRTDPERDRFMEQFWERRDPTPGTPANEAKEEHYRRIAYANDRFAAAATAGWKTDTGRIYIINGPADEIEAHPSGGGPLAAQVGEKTPYQMWRYRNNGFYTMYIFVDRGGDGAFELNER